jgi:hypothetical protein
MIHQLLEMCCLSSPIYSLYATLTRKHGRAIDVTIVFPCEEQCDTDEHEHAQNTGNELLDSHPLTPSAITNGFKVAIGAESTQWAAIAGLTLHLSRPFVGASIINARVHGGRCVRIDDARVVPYSTRVLQLHPVAVDSRSWAAEAGHPILLASTLVNTNVLIRWALSTRASAFLWLHMAVFTLFAACVEACVVFEFSSRALDTT